MRRYERDEIDNLEDHDILWLILAEARKTRAATETIRFILAAWTFLALIAVVATAIAYRS